MRVFVDLDFTCLTSGLDQPIAPGVSQRPLNWGDLDFDHVPVGLLSETYEELMYRFDADGRRDTSVYYTPSHIAEYMVAEALSGHSMGSRARVLDPASEISQLLPHQWIQPEAGM